MRMIATFTLSASTSRCCCTACLLCRDFSCFHLAKLSSDFFLMSSCLCSGRWHSWQDTHTCMHTHTQTHILYGYTHTNADTLTRTLVNDNYCTLLSRVCSSLTKLSTRITLSNVLHTLANWKLFFPLFSSIQLPSSGKFPGMSWWG